MTVDDALNAAADLIREVPEVEAAVLRYFSPEDEARSEVEYRGHRRQQALAAARKALARRS